MSDPKKDFMCVNGHVVNDLQRAHGDQSECQQCVREVESVWKLKPYKCSHNNTEDFCGFDGVSFSDSREECSHPIPKGFVDAVAAREQFIKAHHRDVLEDVKKTIKQEIAVEDNQIAGEVLAGNIVKEAQCRGIRCGLEVALVIIERRMVQ
jgi:hypothetical protein